LFDARQFELQIDWDERNHCGRLLSFFYLLKEPPKNSVGSAGQTQEEEDPFSLMSPLAARRFRRC
jgi:hypothetical protein